ncbi:MAG: hypothetical protein Q4D62_00425 [Planctomycetia bacterium]|nr:hypothetical protein [Planctomycetia bacterium]
MSKIDSRAMLKAIEDGQTYTYTKRTIHQILQNFCKELEPILQKQFPDLSIHVKAGSWEKKPSREQVLLLGGLAQTMAKSKIIRNNGIVVSVKGNPDPFCILEYEINDVKGYPVVVTYGHSKIYCESEDALATALLDALTYQATGILEFLGSVSPHSATPDS